MARSVRLLAKLGNGGRHCRDKTTTDRWWRRRRHQSVTRQTCALIQARARAPNITYTKTCNTYKTHFSKFYYIDSITHKEHIPQPSSGVLMMCRTCCCCHRVEPWVSAVFGCGRCVGGWPLCARVCLWFSTAIIAYVAVSYDFLAKSPSALFSQFCG